jgi:LacI family transcriptional regulator
MAARDSEGLGNRNGRRKDSRQVLETAKPLRLRDVAEAAGVSVTTVSVVLNDAANSGIPDRTRAKVLRAARRLGYVPDVAAQSLRTKRSRTLGFIADRIASGPYAGQMIAGAQAAAWQAGYVLLVVDTRELEELAELAARVLLGRRVEGVILGSEYHRAVAVPLSLRAHNPVLADCFSRSGDYWAVVPDEAGGGYAATCRLLKREVAPVGFINLSKKIPATTGRLKGYKSALREFGVAYDPRLVLNNESGDAHEGYELTTRLLNEHQGLRLLFCGNDRTAMGAYEAIKLRGLRIPEDVAVVGFDNQEIIANELMPGLTSVALPHYEMGQRAAERALQCAAHTAKRKPLPAPKVELAACQLMERCSV